MDRGLRKELQQAKSQTDVSTTIDSPRHIPQFWCILRRLQERPWMCTHARWQGCGLHISTTTASRRELSNSWFGIGRCCACFENLETLSYWKKVLDIYRPQESQVYIHSTGLKPSIVKMARVGQGLWPWDKLSPGKANVVADALDHKPASLNALMDSLPPELCKEIAQLSLVIVDAGLASILEVAPILEEEIHSAQADDK